MGKKAGVNLGLDGNSGNSRLFCEIADFALLHTLSVSLNLFYLLLTVLSLST